MANTPTLTIRLHAGDQERLEALAEATKRTRSFLAAEAVAEFLAREEWQVAAVREALADLAAGEVPVEHARVVAWLDSWGTEHELPTPD
jgi:predicted transcriptional regulator